MPNLVALGLSDNQITSVEALGKLVNLAGINLSGNQITSIEGLSGAGHSIGKVLTMLNI